MVVQEDTVFISGMDPNLTEEDIAQHFGAIGVIKVRFRKHLLWEKKNSNYLVFIFNYEKIWTRCIFSMFMNW